MKKLLIILCFLPMFSFGGTIYKVLSDTVFIGSIPYRTATGELLLFNATKDTTESVLYNTGNGKTEFKKVRLIRLNDSTYVFKIGTTVIGDSIKIHSGGSGGGGSGTVTDFIFTDGNGFDGTVTNSTTTPTLSLAGDTIFKFASVNRLLDSLIDVNTRITNGDSIYFSRTYLQLRSAMSAHTLKGGAKYKMTNFATIYDQSISNITKTATGEVLILTANSDSTFAPIVSSLDFPTDVIHYDIAVDTTYVNAVACKGKITYREDINGNKLWFDWRKVLMYNIGTTGEALTFDLGNLITANEFPITGLYFETLAGLEFPACYFEGSVFQNINNIVYGSYFSGDFAQNTNNTITGTVVNDFIQNTNLNIDNCTFVGSVNYGNTGSWSLSTFGGNVSKNTEVNYLNTTVGGNIDRLINCAFLTDTIGGRLWWCQNIILKDVYVETNARGLNSLTVDSTHIDCSIENINGVTMFENKSGFYGCNIDGTNSASIFGNIRVDCLVSGKTISEALYPELFNVDYTKTIFKGSDGNVYYSYYNGATYVIIEIN